MKLHIIAAGLSLVAVVPTLSSFYPEEKEQGITVAAAGDIASCQSQGDEETAKLIDDIAPNAVLTLGDNAYEDGTAQEFQDCYEPSWGRFKDITYPAIGNHDYGEDGYEGMDTEEYDASAYFDYFGSVAGERDKGWYSYNLGEWHLIALNSDCDTGVNCDPYSKQMQ